MENKKETIVSALGVKLPTAEDPEVDKALSDHYFEAVMETFVAGLGEETIAHLKEVIASGDQKQIEATIKEIASVSPQLGSRLEARIQAETELLQKLLTKEN